MKTYLRASALAAAVTLIALPCEAQNTTAIDTSSVLEGVYSSEQAAQGTRLFEQQCSLCHFPGEFSGPAFEASWVNRPVGALWGHIRMTMPLDNPGSLSAAQYSAVLAYLLRLNGYPAGEKALPADPDSLAVIRMDPPPDGGERSR